MRIACWQGPSCRARSARALSPQRLAMHHSEGVGERVPGVSVGPCDADAPRCASITPGSLIIFLTTRTRTQLGVHRRRQQAADAGLVLADLTRERGLREIPLRAQLVEGDRVDRGDLALLPPELRAAPGAFAAAVAGGGGWGISATPDVAPPQRGRAAAQPASRAAPARRQSHQPAARASATTATLIAVA